MVLPTGLSTPSTSGARILTYRMEEWCGWSVPSRRDDGVCGLSDVLEKTSGEHLKYFLSRKACAGIVRRAASRGKELPKLLADALAYQIAWWDAQAASTPTSRGGVKSLNHGHAGTLVNGTCPGCHSGVVEVYENHAQDCRVKPCGEVAPTLNGKMGTGGNNVPLKAECFVKVSHARGADGLGERWERGECAGTRNAIEGGDGRSQECVVMTNSNGEDVSPTLSRDCRSTGNQIEKNGGYVLERRVLSCGEGASHSPAVIAQHGTDPHAVCFGINANGVTKTAQMPCREECAETLAVRHQGGVLVPNVASMRYVVRRLTPTECERLMGLPDGWTLPVFAPDEITDALVAEFVEIFDTFGSIMAGYAGKNPPKPKTATWVRKWLERIANPATCPDAPRYKSDGNGMATNQVRWIFLRVLAKEGIDPWNSEP